MEIGPERGSWSEVGSLVGMALTKLRVLLLSYPDHQYVIAAKARIAPTRLSEYANGKRRIPAANLMRLALVLGVRPEQIIGDEDPNDHIAVEL